MSEQQPASQSAESSGARKGGSILGILALLFVLFIPQFATCPACRGWSGIARGFEQGLQSLGARSQPKRGVHCAVCRDDGKVSIGSRILYNLRNTPLWDER